MDSRENAMVKDAGVNSRYICSTENDTKSPDLRQATDSKP